VTVIICPWAFWWWESGGNERGLRAGPCVFLNHLSRQLPLAILRHFEKLCFGCLLNCQKLSTNKHRHKHRQRHSHRHKHTQAQTDTETDTASAMLSGTRHRSCGRIVSRMLRSSLTSRAHLLLAQLHADQLRQRMCQRLQRLLLLHGLSGAIGPHSGHQAQPLTGRLQRFS
jgi:hypothetical protein